MPLIHSPAKKPFQHNIKSELDAGKPMKQSLAIAYAVKRRAQEKKKMAAGGMVDDEDMSRSMDKSVMSQGSSHNEDLDPMSEPMGQTKTSSLPDESLGEERMDAFFAHGGMANPKALAMKIMAKRKMAAGGMASGMALKMADGGEADENAVRQGLNRAFAITPKASPTPLTPEQEQDKKINDARKKLADKGYNMNYAEGGAVAGPVEDSSVPPPGGADEFLSDEEQDPYPEDPREKRRRMISNIMRDLHSSARGTKA